MIPTIEQQVMEAVRGLPETKQMQVLSYVKEISQIEVGETEQRPKKRKLFEKLEEIRAKLPPDAFEGYPTDGSLNHDHYLYGSAKREQE